MSMIMKSGGYGNSKQHKDAKRERALEYEASQDPKDNAMNGIKLYYRMLGKTPRY